MNFTCFEIGQSKELGVCTLPAGRYDPVGTEHMFGDTVYILVETRIGSSAVMYFRKKK